MEAIFIAIAGIVAIFSIGMFFLSAKSKQSKNPELNLVNEKEIQKDNIQVEIAGAIIKPNVYNLTEGSRLKDLIEKAGGLSEQAEFKYVARNLNQAKILEDQEKIYIPSRDEIESGLFGDFTASTIQATIAPSNKYSINKSTFEELDRIPGVGITISMRIIQNRPYKSIDELLSKKVINQSLFDKIKSYLTN